MAKYFKATIGTRLNSTFSVIYSTESNPTVFDHTAEIYDANNNSYSSATGLTYDQLTYNGGAIVRVDDDVVYLKIKDANNYCSDCISNFITPAGCNQYNLLNGESSSGSEPITFNWTVCHSGDPGSTILYPEETYTICSTTYPTISNDPSNYGVIEYVGACPTTFNLILDITEGMGQSIFGYFNIFVARINQFGSFETEHEYLMKNGEYRVETIPYEPGDIIRVEAVARVADGIGTSITLEGVDEEGYLYNEYQESYDSENSTPQISGDFIMPYRNVTIYLSTY